MAIRDLPKEERHEAIIREAYNMARSGKFKDWSEIEIALRGSGLADARNLLDDRQRRSELNAICKEASS